MTKNTDLFTMIKVLVPILGGLLLKANLDSQICISYCILSSTVCTFIENDAEKFPAHYTWKVAEKGFKMAFMMNKLAMINSCEIVLEK